MSFRYKFLLVFIAVEAFFVASIVVVNFAAIKNISQDLMQEQLQSSAKLFSEVVITPLMVNDLATIDDAAERFVEHKNILRVEVLNKDGKLLSSASNKSFKIDDYSTFNKLDKQLHQFWDGHQQKIELDKQTYFFYQQDIVVANQVIGKHRFIYNATEVLNSIADSNFLTLLIVAIELIIGTIVAILIGFGLTRQLNHLSETAERIAQGEEVSFDGMERSKGEIADLAKTMETMQSRIQQRTAALRRAQQEAQQANEAKSEFLAVMSHEIRTPLNGIIGSLNLIEEEDMAERDAAYLHVIKSSSEHLLSVINDILDYSKIQAGKFTLEPEAVDLNLLLDGLALFYEPLFSSRGLHFKLEKENLDNAYIYADKVRLQQILNNYLNNALKFTERGGVVLKVVRNQQDGLIFSVEDTGIGIKPEAMQELFQDFNQLHRGSQRQYGGTGLGLFICKRLAELMGGSVGVSSEFGSGSTFHMQLQPKWLKNMPQMHAGAREQDKEIDYSKVSVLLVEDNQVNQLIAKKLLERIGVKVSVAENGKQALESLQHSSFDLVFMDCQMPVMDGYEATRRLREFDRHTPVIALTANIQPADRKACFQVGMNDYISKPFKPEDMTQMLNRYCHLSPRSK